MRDFLTIAITSPRQISNEVKMIESLLDSDAIDFVHLRKPDASEEEMRQILSSIEKRLHPRIKIHSHFNLCNEYHLGGIHLNFRWSTPPSKYMGRMSRSCHSIEEIEANHSPDEYCTLSPIYDSISKVGYSAKANFLEKADKLRGKNVIALGGITPERFLYLKSLGFAGAAMLGYIWNQSRDIKEIIQNILKFKNYVTIHN